MYQTIIAGLETVLNELVGAGKKIGIVYSYPETKLTKFPAIVFYPVSLDNSYHSNEQNKKSYRFLIAVVMETGTATVKKVYNELMPAALDDVIAKLDERWNGGQIDGGRVWITIDNGDWIFAEQGPDGPTVTAFLFVTVQFVNQI